METDDQTTSTATDETSEETLEESSETTSDEQSDEKPDEKPALTAEQLQSELTRTRAEAANYRVRLREAEGKLAEAKTPEEVEAAVTEFRTRNAELEREILVTRVAAKYELPDTLAARLKGDDEAALEADAKALATLIALPAPESLGGGLSPGESDDDEFDPVAAAHAAKKRPW